MTKVKKNDFCIYFLLAYFESRRKPIYENVHSSQAEMSKKSSTCTLSNVAHSNRRQRIIVYINLCLARLWNIDEQ